MHQTFAIFSNLTRFWAWIRRHLWSAFIFVKSSGQGLRTRLHDFRNTVKTSLQNIPKLEDTEWHPWETSPLSLTVAILIKVLMITTIAALLVVSNNRFGFVNLPDTPKFLAGHPALAKALWNNGILYTVLPPFVITCYSVFWESIVSTSLERAPFVELKNGKAKARATIFLDYSKLNFFEAVFRAFRNRHFLLAACIVSVRLLALIVIPLTAFLFTDARFNQVIFLDANITTSFSGTFNTENETRPAISAVLAELIYGANPPAWTNGGYSFPVFLPLDRDPQGNFTIQTFGYSANLDCVEIRPSEYNLTRQPNSATITVSAEDRGCQITTNIDLTIPYTIFLQTLAITTCSLEAFYSRLGLLGWNVIISPATNTTEVANLTLISCVPTYWKTPGNLTVTFGTQANPVVNAFLPDNQKGQAFRPANWNFYEVAVQMPQGFDFQSQFKGNEFGRLTYEVAKRINQTNSFQPATLIRSVEQVYAYIFAVFSTNTYFQTLEPNQATTTAFIKSINKLIVVSIVAYIIMGALSAICVLNIFLVYSSRYPSILFERPMGIFSYAAIIHESEQIFDLVGEVKTKANPFDGKAHKRAKKHLDINSMEFKAYIGSSGTFKIELNNRISGTISVPKRFDWKRWVAKIHGLC